MQSLGLLCPILLAIEHLDFSCIRLSVVLCLMVKHTKCQCTMLSRLLKSAVIEPITSKPLPANPDSSCNLTSTSPQESRYTRKMPKRKKACTECRQQKAKCDVYLDPEQPCSRCRKVKAHCVIYEPFRRESKRQRLSQLQEEVEELRRGPTASAGSRSSLDAQLEVQERTSPILAGLGPVTPEPSLTTEGDAADRTKPRVLNGVTVSGEEIDDLFQVYVGVSIACVDVSWWC